MEQSNDMFGRLADLPALIPALIRYHTKFTDIYRVPGSMPRIFTKSANLGEFVLYSMMGLSDVSYFICVLL